MALYITNSISGIITISTLKIDDTDASNYLTLDWNENDTSDRTLNLLVSGGNRAFTISGDSTINQNVGTGGSPTFAGMTLTGLSGVLKATTGVVSGSAAKADIGLTNVEDTALSTWAGTANITTLGTIATGSWNATTIPVNKGGTGLTSYAIGDIVYASATGTIAGLADVATGSYLASGGVNTAPAWATLNSAAVGLGSVENTALSTWAGTTNVITIGAATATSLVSASLTGGAVSGGNLSLVSTSHATKGLVNIGAGDAIALGNTAGQYQIIKDSTAGGIASSSDLRIGLDESMRTLIICDRGDIATDFGLSAYGTPSINIRSAAGTTGMTIDSANITTSSTGTDFIILTNSKLNFKGNRDTTGDMFTFNSSANVELTSSNSQQSWVYIEPKPLQTSTAAFDGLYININGTVTPTYGDGSTGAGNNFFRCAVAGATRYSLTTAGNHRIYNSTAVPSASITDGVILYADDVSESSELRVRDEGGTHTTLSPHNFSLFKPSADADLPWSYYSKNDLIGKEINVDMWGAIRAIEDLTGEKFIHTNRIRKANIYEMSPATLKDLPKWVVDRMSWRDRKRRDKVLTMINPPYVPWYRKLWRKIKGLFGK